MKWLENLKDPFPKDFWREKVLKIVPEKRRLWMKCLALEALLKINRINIDTPENRIVWPELFEEDDET